MPLSPAELREAIARLPRVSLAHLPTPLEFLPRLTRHLGGPRIYIKRDDCTGLACGGNKARHNEFLFGDALQKGCDMFVWGAGVQSNNCRQTAAACARLGLDCHLILGRGGATGPVNVQGNLLLDQMVGAVIEIVDAGLGPELDRLIAERAAEYTARGRRPYLWVPDIVKPLAAVSYVEVLVELLEQAAAQKFKPSAVYVCSAGSTGAGVALGKKALGYQGVVRSIAPLEWPWDTTADLARIANLASERMGIETWLEREEIDIDFEFIAPGYGQMSPAGAAAIQLLARTEGIVLDHVYTGKALAGLIQHIRAGQWGVNDSVVFIHTGGVPALFAEADTIATAIPPRPAESLQIV